MSLPTVRPFRLRQPLLVALAGAVGVLLGAGGVWLLRDPHTATAEHLVGTVTWSNPETRLIAFEADGETRDPLDGDTIYAVTGDWVDKNGTMIGSGSEPPACLASEGPRTVTTKHRRVELDVIHQSFGGPQNYNIAVSVHCLD